MSKLVRTFLIIFMIINLTHSNNTLGQEFDLRGQVSGWAITNPEQATQLGLRYIPDLMLGTYWDDYILDSELSVYMVGSVQFQHDRDTTLTRDEFDSYRLWLRFAGSQYEVRAGLQKINFGSAMLLRALMWFDSVDPRDPLQLTFGVWGVSGRYFLLNNASIWLWVLYGNDENRGWEILPSDKHSPEFGGRIQVPLLTGEMAVTFHHRKIGKNLNLLGYEFTGESKIPENRIGLDGKWDIEIGIWAEIALIQRELDYKSYNYQRQTNLGVDYTFDWGNGLYAIAEYFTFNLSDKAFGRAEGISLTAFSLDYPLGLLDNFTAIIYYEWDNQDWYRFLRWERTYNNWNFYLMGFWNPNQYQLFPGVTQNNIFTGKGIQLLAVFNH
jgi:hypothetical protein